MRSHELAKHLLQFPDQEVTVSVDMSTCDDDFDHRVFGHGLCESVHTSQEWTLCFEKGYQNWEDDKA